MPAPKEPEHDSPLAVWGSELRHYRTQAGLSQTELGARISYSPSLVSAVEIGQRAPSDDMAQRCDDVLETGGALTRLRTKLVAQAWIEPWFRQWREVEEGATTILWYDAMVVPGLLQTERYARTLLGGNEEWITARLERQRILSRETPPPPTLRFLIDEGAFRRPVGDAATMREQLEYLASFRDSPRVTIQVVPYGVCVGLQGPCGLATVDGEPVGYLDTAIKGVAVSGREDIAAINDVLDAIRAEALPRRASTELIGKLAEEWT